jgi:hypothetical protein
MDELSSVHKYGAGKVYSTLEAGNQMAAAGELDPLAAAELHLLKLAYLQAMIQAAGIADARLLAHLETVLASSGQPSLRHALADWLAAKE